MSDNEQVAAVLREIKAAWQVIKGSANYMPGSAVREALVLLEGQLPNLDGVAEAALEVLHLAASDTAVIAENWPRLAVRMGRMDEALERLGQRAGEEG